MSWWKTLAKIAIPVGAAVAAPFTGGGSLGLLGLGAGAGAATGALDGGWKGALKGAAIGGASSALAGPALGKLGKVFGSGSSSVGSPAMSAAGSAAGKTVAPSISEILANPSLANIANGTLATSPGVVNGVDAATSGGSGWMSKLSHLFGGNDNTSGEGSGAQNMADLGSTLGAFGQAESSNRYMKGAMTQKYDDLVNTMTKTNQASESDALKKLAQTKYLMNGGAQPINYNGASGTLTNYGFGPTPASDAQKTGAQTLQDQLLKRLTPEGGIHPTDPNTYLNAGKSENVGKWGALGSSGLGTLMTMFGNKGN